MMTPVKTQFEFTFNLYKKTLSLHRSHSPAAMIAWGFIFWLSPAIALMSICALGYLYANDRMGAAFPIFLTGEVFSIWFVVGLLAIWRRTRHSYRTIFSANSHSKAVELEITSDGVTYNIADTVSSKVIWKNILKWVEDEELFLIYINKSRYIPIPRAGLNAIEAQSIKSYLENFVERSK